MKKKILIFSLNYFPKHVGGAEVAIKEITDRIPSDEIVFHMVTNRFDSTLPKVEQVGNVLVHRIGITKNSPEMSELGRYPLHLNKFLYQFTAYWKAKQLHKKYAYDAIWAMMALPCSVPAGSFKAAFPEVKYLLTLQEGHPISYMEDKMRILRSKYARGFEIADALQAISTFLGDWGKSMGFEGSIEIIPNGVDISHFTQRYTSEQISRAKNKLGKRKGDIFLVTTSRLAHKNAIDDVICAVSLLPQNVHFVVYGTGPDREFLLELARKLKVQDRIHFLGYIDHLSLPLYLKACDIFIRPSRSEGMGNSFIEAMAAGLPVIATQEGGLSDFLFDELRNPEKITTGWAVDADSPHQIVEAVTDITGRPDKVFEVCQSAKELAIQKYDWSLISNDMRERVFNRLF